ncbi:MAG: hypothetical protein VKJ04_01245 [Vampirovibrionales bacterium]|nr:hypothetical protein [Vampirovibrionales bacterium]
MWDIDEKNGNNKSTEVLNFFPMATPHRELNPLEEAVRQKIKHWCEEFLAKPHPELGIPNRPVCPFVPAALERNSIWLAVSALSSPSVEQMQSFLAQAKRHFLSLADCVNEQSIYNAVLVIFPNLPLAQAPQVIDGVQRRTKVDFVSDGLMVGEFHGLNNTPGLHNEDFKPLRTPHPALAIRYMVDSDLLFLTTSQYSPNEKVAFLTSYLNRGFERNRLRAEEALVIAEKDLQPS